MEAFGWRYHISMGRAARPKLFLHLRMAHLQVWEAVLRGVDAGVLVHEGERLLDREVRDMLIQLGHVLHLQVRVGMGQRKAICVCRSFA